VGTASKSNKRKSNEPRTKRAKNEGRRNKAYIASREDEESTGNRKKL